MGPWGRGAVGPLGVAATFGHWLSVEPRSLSLARRPCDPVRAELSVTLQALGSAENKQGRVTAALLYTGNAA